MKKCLKKLLAVILVASLIISCSSILASAADEEYDSCLDHYFSELDGNIPENVVGSCGYVSLCMLLGYYDMYWNDNFVADEYETKVSYNSNISSMDSAALKTENQLWNDLYSAYIAAGGTMSRSEYAQENYESFVRAHRNEGYLHLDLLNEAIDGGYYDTILPLEDYGVFTIDLAVMLDRYFDGIFGEYRYYDPLYRNDLTGDTPPISIKVLSNFDIGVSYDDVLQQMEELLLNDTPVIYTGVKLEENSFSGHVMIAYDTIEDSGGAVTDYQFHTGWVGESYDTFNNTDYDSYISIIWLEIDTNQLPHICCDKFTTVFGYDICSCDAYELQHPYHTHKALYDAEMCPLAPINKRCICGEYVNSPHTYIAEYNNLEHWEECACGAFKNKSAHDFGPYLSYSASLHKKTCDCGYYIAESHTLVRLNLKLYGCTSCTYTRLITDEEMVHLGIDEETEGDLS